MYGFINKNYKVSSPWFSDEAEICTYCLDELISTKLRALFQRSKGRDLFDLWLAIRRFNVDCEKVVQSFKKYNAHHKTIILRPHFEANLAEKMANPRFLSDIQPLLIEGTTWDENDAWKATLEELIARL